MEYRDRVLRAVCTMWKHWAPHEEQYQRSLGNGPPVHDGPMKVVNEFSESSETEDALLRAVRQAWIVAKSTEEEEEEAVDRILRRQTAHAHLDLLRNCQ